MFYRRVTLIVLTGRDNNRDNDNEYLRDRRFLRINREKHWARLIFSNNKKVKILLLLSYFSKKK